MERVGHFTRHAPISVHCTPGESSLTIEYPSLLICTFGVVTLFTGYLPSVFNLILPPGWSPPAPHTAVGDGVSSYTRCRR